ncbi:MAG: polysaccharide biosynthesis protein [Candidatus Bathyarchaeota archaeon]|nr:MAG: polysaccharide biosynthesis protein [Candidatus Bathyarchaeota archaeon]
MSFELLDLTLSVLLGKKSGRSSFNLFLGIVTQTLILAVGSIIIGRLLGAAFYGIYSLSSVPATFIGLFAGLGIRSATVRFAAQYNHRDEQERVRETIMIGLSFTALIGSLLTILCFSLAHEIASIFGRIDTVFYVQIMSLTILSEALVMALQSVLVSLERTMFYSFLIILKAFLHTGLQVLFILHLWPTMSFGPLGAIMGFAIASFTTCVTGLFACYFLFIRRKSSSSTQFNLLESLKMMLKYGIPLYISRVVGGFLRQFLIIVMVIFATDILIGNYRVSSNFTVLISFFSVPIATVLFPTFSKLDFREDAETLRKMFRASVKYSSLLIVPITALVIILSQPLVSTLYGATYESAPLFLSLSSLGFLYVGLGQFSISAILNAQGETKKSMILGLANVTIGLPLALILVPYFQIVGIIAAIIISGAPQVIIGSLWVKRQFNVSIEWRISTGIILLSLITGLMTFGVINLFNLNSWLQLIVGATILSAIFIVLAPLSGIINSDDVQNLRTIFSETGLGSILLHIPLKVMAKLCR